MDAQEREALKLIDAMTGTNSTEEQLEFASDFTKPLASFANPGTGKSHSIIKGIIMAQTYHRVPGRKINAMSFTREATAELKARYDKACKKCGITPTATFNTFHSICREIVLTRFPGMQIKSGYDWEKDLAVLQEYMKKRGFDTDDMFYVRRVLKAIGTLNNKLCYDVDNVITKFDYKELDMPLEVFQGLRSDMFSYGATMHCITQGDIPLYALYTLAHDETLQRRYKEKYKIMIVDEFQDMTKLYLVILSMISSNLIVIGDMKQQIFGFNGACAEIADEYMRLYPNAKRVELTQSFRCKNEIAEFATSIYWPNDRKVKSFKGTGDGATVEVYRDVELNLHDIVSKVKVEEDKEDVENAKTTMFLFRNNFSITPVAEELYKQGVLFRVKKFMRVMDYPIFKELSDLACLAMEPNNEHYQITAVKLFPEFRRYAQYNNPYLEVVRGKSIFDVNYKFREASSWDFYDALKDVRDLIKHEAKTDIIFNRLWRLYDKYIIEGKWWKLENTPEFYIDLVRPIVSTKTFPRMLAEENDKVKKIMDANNAGMGVKCYTMHSAKGLEADVVYLLDMDENIVPSTKNFTKLVETGCEYEAALMVREERNLLYVALTRAKEKVVITYYDRLTELLAMPKMNSYSYLDEVYATTNTRFNDVETFLQSINISNLKVGQQSEEDEDAFDIASL